jgi:hypothetical protein
MIVSEPEFTLRSCSRHDVLYAVIEQMQSVVLWGHKPITFSLIRLLRKGIVRHRLKLKTPLRLRLCERLHVKTWSAIWPLLLGLPASLTSLSLSLAAFKAT